jgi:hypothetical protein
MQGISTNVTCWHHLSQQLFMNVGYRFSRLATRLAPYFENRQNVSAEAGIFGNDQYPVGWGPPGLTFASGAARLSDSSASFDRNQTSAGSYSMLWSRGAHNITLGGDFRRQQFNSLSQPNPRGTFTLTGAATGGTAGSVASGSPFADFLLGIPDTSAGAFGMLTNIFASPSTTRTSMTITAARFHSQRRDSLGVRRTHHRALQSPGEPRRCPRLCAVAPVVASDPIDH